MAGEASIKTISYFEPVSFKVGVRSELPGITMPALEDGTLYFSIIDNDGLDTSQTSSLGIDYNKGQIFLGLPNRVVSFGEFSDFATSDRLGNIIDQTYASEFEISRESFQGSVSDENLYFRAFTPSGEVIPGEIDLPQATLDKYTIFSATPERPGLLSCIDQSIGGDKRFKNNIWFKDEIDNSNNFYLIDNKAQGKLKRLVLETKTSEQQSHSNFNNEEPYLLSVHGRSKFMSGMDIKTLYQNDSEIPFSDFAKAGGLFNPSTISLALKGASGTNGKKVSGILFSADDNVLTNKAFIQYYPTGVSNLSLTNSPTIGTNLNGVLAIGVDGNSTGEIWLEARGAEGLKHISYNANNSPVTSIIYDTNNFKHLKFNINGTVNTNNTFDFGGNAELTLSLGNIYQESSGSYPVASSITKPTMPMKNISNGSGKYVYPITDKSQVIVGNNNTLRLSNVINDNGVVNLANGGTGATTAAGARTNLGLGSVATENTVPISKGGTGATTAAAALTNLGFTATLTELNYCDGVTSNIQTQLNAKINKNATQLTNQNLNDYKTDGTRYYGGGGNTVTNKPTGLNEFYLEVHRCAGGNYMQLLYSSYDNYYYYRYWNGSTWSSWKKIATTSDIPSTSSFVKKAGDTLTGQLQWAGVSSSWYNGRDRARLRQNSISGYSPLLSIKTTNGSWQQGACNDSNSFDKLIFSYTSDANYGSSTNISENIAFTANGGIEASSFTVGNNKVKVYYDSDEGALRFSFL